MENLKMYGIIAGVVLALGVVGYVWHVRGTLDSAVIVSGTEKTVEPIRDHENAIKNNPLLAPALIDRLRRAKF